MGTFSEALALQGKPVQAATAGLHGSLLPNAPKWLDCHFVGYSVAGKPVVQIGNALEYVAGCEWLRMKPEKKRVTVRLWKSEDGALLALIGTNAAPRKGKVLNTYELEYEDDDDATC